MRIKVIDPVDENDSSQNAVPIKVPAMAIEAAFTATNDGIFDILSYDQASIQFWNTKQNNPFTINLEPDRSADYDYYDNGY